MRLLLPTLLTLGLFTLAGCSDESTPESPARDTQAIDHHREDDGHDHSKEDGHGEPAGEDHSDHDH